jgi:hypothetical protein
MKGDIALAGFVITAQEWEEMDAGWKAQLVAASVALPPMPVPVPVPVPDHGSAEPQLALGSAQWPVVELALPE